MATILDEITEAIEAYPLTDVTLDIVELAVPGAVLNAGETATFKVKVTNRGPLRITGATVRVSGQHGAQVKDAGAVAPFVADFVSGPLPRIDAHGGTQVTAGRFSLKAPAAPQAATALLKVTLEAWDADFDHMLVSHSRAATEPAATYNAEVAPV